MAMSKEEKAVRDALAQFEKAAAVSDAAVARMNQPGVIPQATAAPTVVPNPRTALEAMSARYAGEARDFAAGTGRYAQPLSPIYRPSTTPVGPTGQTGATGATGPTLTPEQIAAKAIEDYKKQQDTAAEAEKLRRQGQSAYDLLLAEFNQYGLGSLVEPLKALIVSGPSEAQLTLALRQTDQYKKRFAANAQRLASGLRALSEAEYLSLEDQYQNIMRNYGLPANYYTKDDMGRQAGFEKFIAGDVSPAELEDRVVLAQQRVLNAPPEVTTALKQFYPDITNGDILAYTLDPSKGLADIKKKVTAAEIGGAAIGARLGATVGRAEELARYGVTAETARAGFGAIGGGLERGSQLASIYQQQPYTQTIAEEEVFNLPGQTEAQRKRKKIIGLEQAEFAGQTGVTGGALGRERAGSF